MKKLFLTIVSFSLSLATFKAEAQVIFSSNFSDWNNNTPVGWGGSTTNLGTANQGFFEQVIGEATFGTASIRLARETNEHRRFSTQNLTVNNGEVYQVKLWAKGTGDIRVGLFDDRAGSSFGYAPYSPYVTLNNVQEYQEVSASITAANDFASAQFIISVRNTSGSHIIVDSFVVYVAEVTPVEPVSIYDIQFTTEQSGASPLVGQTVTTKGIVTAINPDNGFFIQDGVGAWNGLYVFRTSNQPSVGNEVEVTGVVQEFNSWTQIGQVSNITVLSENNTLPAAIEITTQEMNNEQYESVLVKLTQANAITTPNNFGEWNVNDGSGIAMVQNRLFNFTPSVGVRYDIRGPVAFTFGNFKIWPRGASDITVSSLGVLESENNMVAKVFPNPTSNFISVVLNTEIKGKDLEYSLVDMNGKIIAQENLMSFEGSTVLINVSSLKAGTYILNILLGDKKNTQRIVIQ